MEGYVKAPHDIVRDPSLSPAAKVAWLLIAGMQGYHPTRAQWMGMLRCKDKATWWRVIEELKAAGLVEVTVSGSRRFFKAVIKGEKTNPSTVEKTNPTGVKKPTIEGWENPPLEKNITEEQEKNNCGARARMREEIMQDMMVEIGCRSCGITREQYLRMADEIFSDWEFTGQPEADWNKHHFLSVLRIKTKELKRNGIHQQKRRPTVTGPVSGRTQEENPLAGYPTYGKTGN